MGDAESEGRTNHALWLGPLVAVFGFLSYYTIFFWWPITRDFPWVNLILLAIGVTLSITGLRRAWPRGGWRALAGAVGTLVSVTVSGALVFYVFSLSYGLPDEALALGVGEAIPVVSLSDDTGIPVQLAAAAGERVILVFYRGHW